MSRSPAPLFRDERVTFFGLDHLFVAVWDGAPQLSQMEAMAEHGRAFESSHGPAALVNIAADGTPSFSDDVRRISVELTRDPMLFQVARAHVILMTGFAGIAVRSFINTFLLLGRPPRPTRMLASIEEAAAWLPPFLPEGAWTPETLAESVEALMSART
ncbi:MAG: hypothetical protein ACRBN8_31035 [Nannocystales bacterium]